MSGAETRLGGKPVWPDPYVTGTIGDIGGDWSITDAGVATFGGVLYASAGISASGAITLSSGNQLILASGNYGGFTRTVDDGLMCGIGNGDGQANRHFIFTDWANITKDHDHDTISTNPTVFVHSATDPDTNNTQWGSLAHDQTDFVITSGTGDISLVPAGDVKISAKNIATDTTTGCQIGTASNQKLSFFGVATTTQPAHVADPAACAANTFSHSWDGATDPTQAEGDQIVADLAALKTAIDANNAAIDSILAQLATLGLQAAS